MTDRQLLEAIFGKVESMDERLVSVENRLDTMENRLDTMENRLDAMDKRDESTSSQIGRLVRDVGEIRQRVIKLEADMQDVRENLRSLDAKIESKTDFLASKIDHFAEHFTIERARVRTKLEQERHLRSYVQAETYVRLDAIEHRLEQLEAASP